MKLFKTSVLTLLIIFTFVVFVQAKTYKGVTLPDTVIIKGKSCKLIGMGVRKKFFFKI